MARPKQVPVTTALDMATLLGAELLGNAKVIITGVCPLDDAQESAIAISRDSRPQKIQEFLETSATTAFVVPRDCSRELKIPDNKAVLAVEDPMLSLIALLNYFYERAASPKSISDKAEIHPTAVIAEDVCVGAFAVVGEEAVLSQGCVIHPSVVIYPRVQLGKNVEVHAGAIIREDCSVADNVIIQNGAVIGSDGFGYTAHPEKIVTKVPQVGGVNIAQGVEIGANSCIDRATLSETRIGTGTKIDNLVQVGHNCVVGAFSFLCAQVGLAGRAKVGNGSTLAGQVGVGNDLSIGDKVRLAGKAGVTKSLSEAGDYAGMPAIPAGEWRRLSVLTRNMLKKKSSRKG